VALDVTALEASFGSRANRVFLGGELRIRWRLTRFGVTFEELKAL
jgi:hypothetical protein